MSLNLPKVFLSIKTFINKIDKKNKSFQLFFLSSFIFLFLGLLVGSLIGTFLDTPRAFGFWDGFTILVVILIAEFITFLFYSLQLSKIQQLNLFKIGFLLAIFIDAFKVGS